MSKGCKKRVVIIGGTRGYAFAGHLGAGYDLRIVAPLEFLQHHLA
jgi:hypothetical protein